MWKMQQIMAKNAKKCEERHQECKDWRNVKVSTAQNFTWNDLPKRKKEFELKLTSMVTQGESVIQLTEWWVIRYIEPVIFFFPWSATKIESVRTMPPCYWRRKRYFNLQHYRWCPKAWTNPLVERRNFFRWKKHDHGPKEHKKGARRDLHLWNK